jgi:hypothetical protein
MLMVLKGVQLGEKHRCCYNVLKVRVIALSFREDERSYGYKR